MRPTLTAIAEEARLAARSLVDYGAGLAHPAVRLGVTGLSGAGKTVFLTALVHDLIHGGRLPVFEPLATGRIAGARLEPQPDDAVPRFDYETHLAALAAERRWPRSTRRVSELRLAIDYQSAKGARRDRTLTLDIVDYPGEWLLDLPLLTKSYAEWSAETLTLSRVAPRAALAAGWHTHLATLDPAAPADEPAALTAARLFTAYLRACRDERFAMSLLPPGRFLMPGDLDGSPALTFAPLDLSPGETVAKGSLAAMMARRYEAYKEVVVRPFFRDHFSRLDRQIVLVDALAAFNAGPAAVRDLEGALATILACFRTGRRTFASALFRPRIDRILFAATKADHLHHTSHDRLERILARMTERAIARAAFSGAAVDVVALAAVRATREAQVGRGRDTRPAIVGTHLADCQAHQNGDLLPGAVTQRRQLLAGGSAHEALHLDGFRGLTAASAAEADFRFLRFRPPPIDAADPRLPHIRLDRALQFLIGDRLA